MRRVMGAGAWARLRRPFTRPFTRLHGKLALAYALTTLLALLIVELLAIVAVFVVVNVNLPQFILFGLQQQAQQASPYFVHGTPDRQALTAWMQLPDAFAGGSYQHGFLAIVDSQGRVLAAAGDAAMPADTSLPARLPPHAATDLRHLLGGPASTNGVIGRDGATLTVAAPILVDHHVAGAVVQQVGDLSQANAFWIAFYAQYVVLPSALIFLFIAGLAGAIFGLLTARGFTRRFHRLATVVDTWSRGDFSSFAADTDQDEIGQLARRLNRMAEQLQHLLRAREQLATLEERNRLARDLHDSVKQQVFAVSMQVSTAKALLGSDAESDGERARAEAAAHLGEAERLVHQAQQELTTLIRELRPVALERKGLGEALRESVAEWSQQTGIAAEMEVGVEAEGTGAAQVVEEALYRIAQEALANVARHSGASAVRVRLTGDELATTLTIVDNGSGFDLEATDGAGIGLRSMRERADAAGGAMSIQSAPGSGTTISVRCEHADGATRPQRAEGGDGAKAGGAT